MIEEPIPNVLQSNEHLSENESNSYQNLYANFQHSFFYEISLNEILPYKAFIKQVIKTINVLANDELKNSLKDKYNFCPPTLEIILKKTSGLDNIKGILKKFFKIFGEILLFKYDHNAFNAKMIFKYYYCFLKAINSLIFLLQIGNDKTNNKNNYENNIFKSKIINSNMCNVKYQKKNTSNNEFSYEFKLVATDYKTSVGFNTKLCEKLIGRTCECENNEMDAGNDLNVNFPSFFDGNIKYNDNCCVFSPCVYNQNCDKNRCFNGKNISNKRNYNYCYITNQINNIYNVPFIQYLFNQFCPIDNKNKIIMLVPTPVTILYPLSGAKIQINKIISNIKNTSFSKKIFKSDSDLLIRNKEDKETIYTKGKYVENSDGIKSGPSPCISKTKKETSIAIVAPSDNSIHNNVKINCKKDENEYSKENSFDNKINEINISYSLVNESVIYDKKASNDPVENGEFINSDKTINKNYLYLLDKMKQKKINLVRQNNFLQNEKPNSNFLIPIKNLTPREMNKNDYKSLNKINPNKSPSKCPKINNNQHMSNFSFPFDSNNNKRDFNHIYSNKKKNIKFSTFSPRDYYYKFICNYFIKIKNDDGFNVKKRIIGKNGCIVKYIIRETCIKNGDFSTKIRLRGKGSGYFECGDKESEEPLMLCVSSINYATYCNCCFLIENFLRKIYEDYFIYCLNTYPEDLRKSVTLKKISKYEFVIVRFNSCYNSLETNQSDNNNN